jgi:Fe-S-cluster-containing dehydrogenase component
MKRIAFDPLRCSLCGACMAACALIKAGKPDLSQSRIRIETAGSCVPLRAAVCRHCEEPACVTACMSGIIDRDPETGLVTRRHEGCFRCAACAVNCPVGACVQDEALNAFTACDLCGGDPLCVRVCLSGALRLEEDAQTSSQLRVDYAAKMFEGRPAAPEDLTDAQWKEIVRILAGTGIAPDAEDLKEIRAQIRRNAEEEGM